MNREITRTPHCPSFFQTQLSVSGNSQTRNFLQTILHVTTTMNTSSYFWTFGENNFSFEIHEFSQPRITPIPKKKEFLEIHKSRVSHIA